ncbi:hypothetical protein LJR118_000607 [Acidovorax sp. LjRoot118]|uniref:hypothetical protein n=1 Tax=Acidovorax sp. LjRoot118 TaxID=3342256 RepID=UPI003ED0A88E
MEIKPSLAMALLRLRIDDGLSADLQNALDQAHAATLKYLDGKLYPDAVSLAAANDPKGIEVTADMIAAQLLWADALMGNNSLADRESKTKAAKDMLRPHRNQGA